MKRVNKVGWLMIAIALLFGLRYLIPEINSWMGNPSPTVVRIIVILTALCFGFWGIKPREQKDGF